MFSQGSFKDWDFKSYSDLVGRCKCSNSKSNHPINIDTSIYRDFHAMYLDMNYRNATSEDTDY